MIKARNMLNNTTWKRNIALQRHPSFCGLCDCYTFCFSVVQSRLVGRKWHGLDCMHPINWCFGCNDLCDWKPCMMNCWGRTQQQAENHHSSDHLNIVNAKKFVLQLVDESPKKQAHDNAEKTWTFIDLWMSFMALVGTMSLIWSTTCWTRSWKQVRRISKRATCVNTHRTVTWDSVTDTTFLISNCVLEILTSNMLPSFTFPGFHYWHDDPIFRLYWKKGIFLWCQEISNDEKRRKSSHLERLLIDKRKQATFDVFKRLFCSHTL